MANVSFNSAVAAYNAAARHAGDIVPHPDPGAAQAGAPPDQSSFANMVRDVVATSIDTVRGGEAMSLKAMTGQADTREVVMAVNSAEVTLQTVVAVRDKVVSAYETIMRMPL
jgi:flagellar hook-basal body complex protein FliE